jgi:hypothetical protein
MAEIDEQEDTTRATNDAYTGMLAISLIALLVGCALLYLDYSQYPSGDPPRVTAPAAAPTGGQAVPPPGGGAQGVPPMGNPMNPPAGNPMPMPMNPMPAPAPQ